MASNCIDSSKDEDPHMNAYGSLYNSWAQSSMYNATSYACQAEETNTDQKYTLKASPNTAFTLIKKTKKSVSFKPTVAVRKVHSIQHSKEEKSKLYYSKKELQMFNLEARAICILSQDLPEKTNSGTILEPSRRSIYGLEGNDNDAAVSAATDSLRGLEIMMYPKRNKNKWIARRSLLKYQTILKSRPNMTTEQRHISLAAASAKLNAWSSAVAVETGRLDALRAYADDYVIPISTLRDVSSSATTVSSPISYCKKKRRLHRSTSNRITPENSPMSKKRMIVFG